MVEETAAACHALNQETGELVGLVSKFKTTLEEEQDSEWKTIETRAEGDTVDPKQLVFRRRASSAGVASAALETELADEDGWHDF